VIRGTLSAEVDNQSQCHEGKETTARMLSFEDITLGLIGVLLSIAAAN